MSVRQAWGQGTVAASAGDAAGFGAGAPTWDACPALLGEEDRTAAGAFTGARGSLSFWERAGPIRRRRDPGSRRVGKGGGRRIERTAHVAGAAVVALIAGSGRGPEPGGRGEGADFAMAGERR